MAWTTPKTNFNPGDVLNAAEMNAIGENLVQLAPFFGTWTSWTPTLGGGFSNGNATTAGRYLKIGKMVFYWGTITFGSTTGKGAVMTLSLPVAAASADAGAALTSIYANPAGNQIIFTPLAASASTIEVVTINAASTYLQAAQTNATVPYTWATGNAVRYGGTYEASTA